MLSKTFYVTDDFLNIYTFESIIASFYYLISIRLFKKIIVILPESKAVDRVSDISLIWTEDGTGVDATRLKGSGWFIKRGQAGTALAAPGIRSG